MLSTWYREFIKCIMNPITSYLFIQTVAKDNYKLFDSQLKSFKQNAKSCWRPVILSGGHFSVNRGWSFQLLNNVQWKSFNLGSPTSIKLSIESERYLRNCEGGKDGREEDGWRTCRSRHHLASPLSLTGPVQPQSQRGHPFPSSPIKRSTSQS